MKIKFGGWSRVLIAISAIFLVIAAQDLKYARDKARKEAQSKYESAIAPMPASCLEDSPANSKFRDFICSSPIPEAEARATRDSEIEVADSKSLRKFLKFWLYPTFFIGAAFWAIDWIRRGFRNDRQR